VTDIEVRPADQQRAGRVLLAVSGGDLSGVILTAKEAGEDGAVLGLLLALSRFGLDLAELIAPGDVEGTIVQALWSVGDPTE